MEAAPHPWPALGALLPQRMRDQPKLPAIEIESDGSDGVLIETPSPGEGSAR